jgi:3-mercaptopyruvate sulfurtransferase SseA
VRMRFFISLAIVVFAVVGLLACNSVERNRSSAAAPPASAATGTNTTEQKASDIRRMTTAELKDLIDKGQAFVVDVRTEASYKAGHIKGAVLIPHKTVASRMKELPRDKTIVTYCS